MGKLLGTLIALAAAGGGIAAWYGLIHPAPPPPTSCDIAGNVYTNTDYKPLPGVSVEYDAGSGKYLHAATTGIDGSFKFNCSNMNFPLKLRLNRGDWSSAALISDAVNPNDEALNFYVDRKQGAPPIAYVGPPPARSSMSPPGSANPNRNGVIVPPPPSSPNSNRNGVVVGPPPSLGNRRQ